MGSATGDTGESVPKMDRPSKVGLRRLRRRKFVGDHSLLRIRPFKQWINDHVGSVLHASILMDSLRLPLVLLMDTAANFANSTFCVRGLLATSVIHQVGIL